MKKILYAVFLGFCLPLAGMAQVMDDLYFVPSKDAGEEPEAKEEQVVVADVDEVVVKSDSPAAVYTDGNRATVVVRDRNGRTRDVDEYNRRYEADDYEFSTENGTLYVDEKSDADLDGEWVHGFEGTQDDYEYATRIIRFRNPRYAVSISSPLYWDIVYGLDSWRWNVYTDGIYAYAFPTFSNWMWWDWRFNSFGWYGYPYYSAWNWWGWPSYAWSWGWHGWWGPHYAWYAPHYWHPGPGYWGRPHHNVYTNRRTYGRSSSARPGRTSSARRVASGDVGGSLRRGGADASRMRGNTTTGLRRSSSGSTGVATSSGTGSSTSVQRRVVGTRASAVPSGSSSTVTRRATSGASRGNTGTVYTRPSSGRSSVGSSYSSRTTRGTSTYTRGSSTQSTRTYNYNQTRRSQNYSTPVRSSSGSSRSTFSSGSSMRSSGGGRVSSGSRSGGGRRR